MPPTNRKGQFVAVPLAVRFWRAVKKGRPRECWMWQASTFEFGHGQIYSGGRRGRNLRAPRVCWELTRGRIPKGMQVLHRCDVPGCVNPRHLFLGTAADNMADKVSKGRQPKHETHGRAKLTMKQVREIRRVCAKGVNGHNPKMVNATELARRYGVSRSLINWVRKGTIWT